MRTLFMSNPGIATAIRLKPQAKKVLLHLEKRGTISNLEAWATYGITRLAACVYDLREVGIEIASDLRKDEAGKRYTRYSLV